MTMIRLIFRWIILVVSLITAGYITTKLGYKFTVDYSTPDAIWKLFIGTAILTIFNNTIGLLLKIITLPFNFITLGLIYILINAYILLLASTFNFGFVIDGFWAALIGSIILTLANRTLGALVLGRA